MGAREGKLLILEAFAVWAIAPGVRVAEPIDPIVVKALLGAVPVQSRS